MRRTTAVAALSILVVTITAAANAGVRDVPLTVDRAGGLIVDVKVNRSGPYRFLIDTGSTRTMIVKSLSERLDAPAVARTEVVSAGSSEEAILVRLDSISMGVAGASGVMAIVVPDRRLRELGGKIDGVVGQDFLSRFSYLIDRERATLTWNPTAGERPDGGTTLRLKTAEGRFLVELPQEGADPLLMVPDSGADSLVLFQNAKTARLPIRRTPGRSALSGVSGSLAAQHVTLADLRFGATTLPRQSALLVQAAADPGSDGLLPMKLFRQVMVNAQTRELTVWR